MNLFFGDIHGHSEFSRCFWPDARPCAPSDYFRYARDLAKLDFAALTDHDTSLTDEQWAEVKRSAAAFDDTGRFITFSAYEWTSWVYGHRNVYYLTDDQPMFRCSDDGEGRDPNSDTPATLWTKLRGTGAEVLTIPHHIAVSQFPVDWDFYDPEIEPLVEITSLWGDFEYYGNPHRARISDVLPGHYVQDVLKRGYRLGLVGGGESHDGRPGEPSFGGLKKPNTLPGKKFDVNPLGLEPVPYISDEFANWRGITAVWAPALTRKEIFAALKNRRCYATTGARIQLQFQINGRMMGSELTIDETGNAPRVSAWVQGTADLAKVEIVKNNAPVYSVSPSGATMEIDWTDRHVDAEENYYYLRVEQVDGHKAWSSPVWVRWTSLPLLSYEVLSADGKPKLRVANRGRGDAYGVEVVFHRRSPFRRVATGVPHQFAPEESGVRVWCDAAQPGEKTTLHVNFAGGENTRTFNGSLRLEGVRDYTVRERNFRTLKYGGDLFTDDRASSTVRWHLNVGREEKGLEWVIDSSPFADASAEVSVAVDGRPAENLWLGDLRVTDLPLQIKLDSYDAAARVGQGSIPVLRAGESVLVEAPDASPSQADLSRTFVGLKMRCEAR